MNNEIRQATAAEDGFSLVEALCALIILSAATGIFMQVVLNSTRAISHGASNNDMLAVLQQAELSLSDSRQLMANVPHITKAGEWKVVAVTSPSDTSPQVAVTVSIRPVGSKRSSEFLINVARLQ
jgi:type II secretory pathway pseudopilin PulG